VCEQPCDRFSGGPMPPRLLSDTFREINQDV
jgi:hypothetical protein